MTYSKFAKSKNEKALINHFTIGQEIYTPSSPFFIKDEADPIKYDYIVATYFVTIWMLKSIQLYINKIATTKFASMTEVQEGVY